MQLAMNVSANGDRSLYKLGVGLICEYLFGLLDNELDLLLGDGLERLEVIDDEVEVVVVLTHFQMGESIN